MTTRNQETLVLYKIPKLYNGSRFQPYLTGRTMSSFLSDYTSGSRTLEISYKTLGEPIKLSINLGIIQEYSYGKLTIGGTMIYIFIDSVDTDQHGCSTINYSIDYWSTLWDNITCTNAHVSRYNGSKPLYMSQPYSPLSTTVEVNNDLGSGGCVLFSYIDSIDYTPSGSSTTEQIDLMKYGVIDIGAVGLKAVETGDWRRKIGILATDVTDIFIVPIFTASDFADAGWTTVSTSTVTWYTSGDNGSSLMPTKTIPLNSITTTESSIYGVCDWNGNSIWECPYGVTIDSFYVQFSASVTHCQLRFSPIINDKHELANEVNGMGFTYECRHATIVIDTGEEYSWRDRSYDVSMRELQSEREEVQAVANFGENIGFGVAFGGKVGGAASAVGGGIESIATIVLNSIYNPQIQQLTDEHYDRMCDTMSVVGESLTPVYQFDSDPIYLYMLPATSSDNDDDTATLFNTYFGSFPYTSTPVSGDKAIKFWLKPIETWNRRQTYIDNNGASFDFILSTYNGSTWTDELIEDGGTYITIFDSSSFYSSQYYKQIYHDITDTYPTNGEVVYFIHYPKDMYTNFAYIVVSYYDNGTFRQLNVLDIKKPYILAFDNLYVNHPKKLDISQGVSSLMFSYTLTMDTASQERMENDIAINGYHCDETTDELQTYFRQGAVIQADNVVVEGNMSTEYRNYVIQKLSQGVEFI